MRTKRKSTERGSALLEFALMSTVLMLTTLGVADFGRVFSTADRAASAASAGTAYGALSPAHYTDTEGMRDAAKADLGNISNATIVVTRECRCSTGGTVVTCPASCVAPEQPQTYIKVGVTIPFSASPGSPGFLDLHR